MCTGIRLRAKNGNIVYGRTMEFGQETESKIIILPAGCTFTGTAPLEQSGLVWQSQYAVVGANMLDIIGVVDGVNEKGLAGGLFYFPDYAGFQNVSHDTSALIAPWQLLTWILTTCATVAEVQERLPKIIVGDIIFPAWGFVPPVHAIVHDVQGDSLVIEYVCGKLNFHDSPTGVITNAPAYDWHITNLKNYINLSAYNAHGAALGQGSGMLGLPGDFTAPSRFVRATLLSRNVIESATEDQARAMVFHLLSLFDIPKGVIRDKDVQSLYTDYTQWTAACDLVNAYYYWHTYNNRQVYGVDLLKVADRFGKPHIISMDYPQNNIDVTLL